jgi:hypothetical protein
MRIIRTPTRSIARAGRLVADSLVHDTVRKHHVEEKAAACDGGPLGHPRACLNPMPAGRVARLSCPCLY